MAKALGEIAPTRVLSMYDDNSQLDERYIEPLHFRGFAESRFRFLKEALLGGIAADKVILSHINLLPVGFAIKKLSPNTEIILMAHGIEVWRDLTNWKKNFLNNSCTIWAVSRYTAKVLQEKHGIAPEGIKILNNPLDPYFEIPKIAGRPEQLVYKHGILETDPVLFTLTRLSSTELYKGYDLVIESLPEILKTYPTLLYFIAGKADREEQIRIEKLIQELHLQQNVILLGFLPEEKLTAYYQLADVFVMPSKKEGFGIVFIEAAACGAKVIAGNQDGSTDALLNGRLGTLVDPGNGEGIKDAILQNLATPRNGKDSRTVQNKCLEEFRYDAYRERLKRLIEIEVERKAQHRPREKVAFSRILGNHKAVTTPRSS